MLRFPRHPGPFDYVPGSVDRGLFAFLPRQFSPVLWLAVLGVLLVDEFIEVLRAAS